MPGPFLSTCERMRLATAAQICTRELNEKKRREAQGCLCPPIGVDIILVLGGAYAKECADTRLIDAVQNATCRGSVARERSLIKLTMEAVQPIDGGWSEQLEQDDGVS